MLTPGASAPSGAVLARATGYYDSTITLARGTRPTGPRGDRLTIGLGYLERLRIGTASPFRLVDEALHDPRGDRHDLIGPILRVELADLWGGAAIDDADRQVP